MNTSIQNVKNEFSNSLSYLNDQDQWEYLKYQIRKFPISFSKKLAKETKQKQLDLEKKIKFLEQNFSDQNNDMEEYNNYKNELDAIYNNIATSVKIRGKCNWYELGEKSSKFFLNLEKERAVNSLLKKIIVNDNEITEPSKLNFELYTFYQKLFQKSVFKSTNEISQFLEPIQFPKITNEEISICEKDITEDDLFLSLRSMENDKSPGNDGLIKEFYNTFWTEIKTPLLSSVTFAKVTSQLSISQKQAIIKLMEKKDRDKRYIKNWRPISLLNLDTKLISQTLASRLKDVLPSITSHQQTAYVKNRNISESGRLISDILEICNNQNINGYMVTMDIEKAFDTLDHNFLLTVLEKIGFGKNFISWIKIILANQESCVISGGSTTKYFKLEKGARQGDPISAYLFIIALEVLFIMLKNKADIKGLKIFDCDFLYTAYADDSTFFLSDIYSIKEMINCFNIFMRFSGLKPNLSKCEIAGIGSLKGVKVAVCGMNCIDLTTETTKILGIHFSYNSQVQNEQNYLNTVKSIEKVLKLWRMRNLLLAGKITVFKTLAISKIVYLAMMTPVPNQIINELYKLQKEFLWGKTKNQT